MEDPVALLHETPAWLQLHSAMDKFIETSGRAVRTWRLPLFILEFQFDAMQVARKGKKLLTGTPVG
jgi:hypothetical protein